MRRLKDLTESNKDKGKVILTKDAGGGIGTNKAAPNLTPIIRNTTINTVRIQETDAPENGSNIVIKSIVTESSETKSEQDPRGALWAHVLMLTHPYRLRLREIILLYMTTESTLMVAMLLEMNPDSGY